MALTIASRDGWAFVRNIAADGGEEPLAPEGSYHKVGNHYLGIQRPYQNPILIRTFFDPSGLDLGRYDYLGYIQFLNIQVAGQTVLPSVFGASYAPHAPYASEERGGWFVDFMGLGNARARSSAPETVLPPMYAFNSMLWTDVNSIDGLSRVGAQTTNGLLFQPYTAETLRDTDASECVALRGHIDTSLVTAELVARYLDNARLLVDARVTKTHAAHKTLYELVIEAIALSPLVEAEDKQFALGDISYGRFVGPYLLLNVANFEDMEPVLCARLSELDANTLTLSVRLIDYDTARELEAAGLRDLLERVRKHGVYEPLKWKKAPASGRGQGARFPIPVKNGEPLVTFRVNSCVFGKVQDSADIHFISGVGYRLPFLFDGDSGSLALGAVQDIQEVAGLNTFLWNALAQYVTAFRDKSRSPPVDTSNFDMIGASWITPRVGAPPLPQRKLPVV